MQYADELRIMSELGTFTHDDLAAALECSRQWSSQLVHQLTTVYLVERIRVGHSYLYALTQKAKARVAALPVLDENERCLPLTFDGIVADSNE
jgi:predicted transcriptional regulator